MKEEILKRAMFAMPLSKEAKNSGIMSGFEDDMEEDEMLPMERSPQNPEILMNTLRGDMRSVDARYMELAQMVGEEAAMETPPEVLAMLQEHFAMMQQPQAGIGGLPQGAGMMPPPMGGPEQMPMQGAPMPMDQGPMMPPGGEGMAGPFPQGGAEQAPPTPDGLPPVQAAVGAFITPALRAAQMAGPRLTQMGQAANAALGRMFMNPRLTQPYLENVRGAAGRYTAEQVARGGNLQYPTFTQGLAQGATELAAKYPTAAPLLTSAAGMLGMMDGGPEAEPDRTGRRAIGYEVPVMAPASGAGGGRGFVDERYYENVPGMSRAESSAAAQLEEYARQQSEEAAAGEAAMGTTLGLGETRATEEETKQAPSGADLASIVTPIKAPEPKSKIDRIREARDEYAPLFKELMGDTKQDMKTNALLLLADAGFKFAGATEPTMAMSLAKAAEGLPKGFAALIAQAKDRNIKMDTAALTQAIEDVNAQDKAARDLQMEVLKGDYRLLTAQAKAKGGKFTDAGLGGRITEDKNGSFLGFTIDPKDPSVTSALRSEYTLRDTDNPFVENLGEAPTTVETDKAERIKLGSGLRSIDNALAQLSTVKRNLTEVYSPGSWVTSKVNNVLVPLSGGLVRPDVDQAKAATSISTALNRIQKAVASANDTGRVAVQEQEWVRQTTEGINDPQAFFTNRELAAAQLNALETELRNSRQQLLTQLGYEKNNYVMSTPNTGTQSDPFVVGSDPEAQKRMYTFLKSTVGTAQNPNASVYLKMPNGSIQAFTAAQLRSINLK